MLTIFAHPLEKGKIIKCLYASIDSDGLPMVLSLPTAKEIHKKPVRGVELWPAVLRHVRRYVARI